MMDRLVLSIDIRGETPNTGVYFMGPTFLVAHTELQSGNRYSVKTSGKGVVTDRASRPLGAIASGEWEFTVVAVDIAPPVLLAHRIPTAGSGSGLYPAPPAGRVDISGSVVSI